jgi:hypothetical protein
MSWPTDPGGSPVPYHYYIPKGGKPISWDEYLENRPPDPEQETPLVPDYPEPIKAYRTWLVTVSERSLVTYDFNKSFVFQEPFKYLDVNLLPSVQADMAWTPGPNSARCAVRESKYTNNYKHGRLPEKGCSCGFYGLWELSDATARMRWGPPNFVAHERRVFGEVAGVAEYWGKIHEHRKGLKAQFAQPLAVAISIDSVSDGRVTYAALESLQQKYDIAIVGKPGWLKEVYRDGDGHWRIRGDEVGGATPEEAGYAHRAYARLAAERGTSSGQYIASILEKFQGGMITADQVSDLLSDPLEFSE